MSKLKYTATITGRGPFAWRVNGPPIPPNTSERYATGESDTYPDALADATAVARQMEDRRIDAITKCVEVVLEVDAAPPAFDPFESIEPINR